MILTFDYIDIVLSRCIFLLDVNKVLFLYLVLLMFHNTNIMFAIIRLFQHDKIIIEHLWVLLIRNNKM